MSKEELEGYLAEGLSLERIGNRVGRHPSTVSYHLKKHGLRPVNRGKHANRGPIDEAELRSLIASGCSLREIAARLDRSVGTVRHWVKRYALGPTAASRRRASIRQARLEGRRNLRLECLRHGTTPHVIEKGGRVRCKRCRSEAVSETRRRIKRILVEEAGGACLICGYDRCFAALEWSGGDALAGEGEGRGAEVRIALLELPRRGRERGDEGPATPRPRRSRRGR